MSDTERSSGLINSAPSTEPPLKLPENNVGYRWLMLTPVYCDYYTAQIFSNGIVRMSFGEYFTKDYEAVYRASIAMPIQDVRMLHRTLGRLIKEYDAETKVEAAKPAPSE